MGVKICSDCPKKDDFEKYNRDDKWIQKICAVCAHKRKKESEPNRIKAREKRNTHRINHQKEKEDGTFYLEMVVCSGCHEEKSRDHFVENLGTERGVNSKCKDCETFGKMHAKYGIDRSFYNEIMEKQHYRCVKCNKSFQDFAHTTPSMYENGEETLFSCENCHNTQDTIDSFGKKKEELIQH